MQFISSEYENTLASYAQKSSSSQGRNFQELPHPFRNPFQRDRDRIVHSRAFRRLENKTQVLANHLGDHYRTRLTHSIEVSMISRSIARVLHIHEDLVEAIALAHDLGHPPFGHAGEKILNSLMKSFGGFEHNIQSLRVVDVLENPYPQFRGLNLTFEIRKSLIKNRSVFKKMDICNYQDFNFDLNPSLEAQVVDISDEITYSCHDLEDALTLGYLKIKDISQLKIVSFLDNPILKLKKHTKDEVLLYHFTRSLINLLVKDVVENTKKLLKTGKIKTISDITSSKHKIVSLSPEIDTSFQELRSFLLHNFYRHPEIIKMVAMSKQVISGLFYCFADNPTDLPLRTKKRIDESSKYRAICDYIAGMTDRYALNQYKRRKIK